MGQPRPVRLSSVEAQRNHVTLDAGALIAIERRDRRVLAMLQTARLDGWTMLIPTGALAQVWRKPAQQAVLAAFLKWRSTRSVPLTDEVARRAGILCGRRETTDVVDASVALCCHDHGGRVLTSDPDDLRRLIPSLHVVAIT